jgi:hypothetical protein
MPLSEMPRMSCEQEDEVPAREMAFGEDVGGQQLEEQPPDGDAGRDDRAVDEPALDADRCPPGAALELAGVDDPDEQLVALDVRVLGDPLRRPQGQDRVEQQGLPPLQTPLLRRPRGGVDGDAHAVCLRYMRSCSPVNTSSIRKRANAVVLA